jgi:hypothetical protein
MMKEIMNIEHHRLISSILHQAEKEMYVMYNAAERATPPKAEKKKPDYYQPEVLNKIIRALDDAPTKWKCMPVSRKFCGRCFSIKRSLFGKNSGFAKSSIICQRLTLFRA